MNHKLWNFIKNNLRFKTEWYLLLHIRILQICTAGCKRAICSALSARIFLCDCNNNNCMILNCDKKLFQIEMNRCRLTPRFLSHRVGYRSALLQVERLQVRVLFSWLEWYSWTGVGEIHGFRDFLARQVIAGRHYLASIRDGPWLWNHVSKVWRVLINRSQTGKTNF